MSSRLVEVITSPDPAVRDRSLDAFCRAASTEELQSELRALDAFRRSCPNLYERVRALFFLYAIHRFHLLQRQETAQEGRIPFAGYEALLARRFEEAIDIFLRSAASAANSSALAAAYKSLAFQTLADQVRRSVRSVRGNQWMFRSGHPADHPLRLRPELLRPSEGGLYPIVRERTPVRMDLSHSAWSDIFFLGMDYPEGARVLNISIDLALRGVAPQPPVEAWFRVIDEPVMRLVSVDLEASAEIRSLAELFDFARDYLGLLKAAVIASGLVPAGLEGATQPFGELLLAVTGARNRGFELVSKVNNIPKGSRLAVSTNLLAALISVLMRATGQCRSLSGGLPEPERRLVAARAILGEWLGGSGGGWQDSGGVWPGIKLIEGAAACEGDPEHGISRGTLLPAHHVFGENEIPASTRKALEDSLVLVHGGMAQDVGPILEMVTEKYLLRSEAEWAGRREAQALFDTILANLKTSDIRALGGSTEKNFDGPLQAIIPWASNHYTETLIARVREEFGGVFWGFWMLGGMSGGGMGFMFHPEAKPRAQARLQEIMREVKAGLQSAVPFAMDPVVYDFAINERGTWSDVLNGGGALMPAAYYALTVPALVKTETRLLAPSRRAELDQFSEACRTSPELSGMVQTLFDRLVPRAAAESSKGESLDDLLTRYGFDRVQHEQIRADLRNGRIGLAQNRLPQTTVIEDVRAGDVELFERLAAYRGKGQAAIERGEVAVVTLAGGAGSRWTRGAGVVKALNPFLKIGGRHRNFLDIHQAKFRGLPWVVTTSYLTHEPIRRHFEGDPAAPVLSEGRSIGLRLIPTVRDLRFAWEQTPQQMLDEQKQKVRESLHAALIGWAQSAGEASDYTDNLPAQCLHPVGHWYEVPNLLLNGTLRSLFETRPNLRYLMVHNVDTLGVTPDAAVLGFHMEHGAALTCEVIPRHIEDRGGGLARVDGRVRLVEGLALPDERCEFDLTYYNSNTFWIDLEALLGAFGLGKAELNDAERVRAAVRAFAGRMPTYITLKDVKKRWGKGQEDIFPVAQWEKLWGDMTALPGVKCGYVAVPRLRGQQLKEVAQLDAWVRDGSAAYVANLMR